MTAAAIGGVDYDQAELLDILGTSPKGDMSYILGHQLIAARLNVAAGASVPELIAVALDDAEDWLVANPLGSKPKKGDKSDGADLESLLDQYNNGLQGPPHCD